MTTNYQPMRVCFHVGGGGGLVVHHHPVHQHIYFLKLKCWTISWKTYFDFIIIINTLFRRFHCTLPFTVHIYASTKQIIIFNVEERAHISSIPSLEYRFLNNEIENIIIRMPCFGTVNDIPFIVHPMKWISFRLFSMYTFCQLLDPFTPPLIMMHEWMKEKIEFRIKNSLFHHRLDSLTTISNFEIHIMKSTPVK